MAYKSTRTSLVYMFFTYIPMLCVSEAFLRAQEVPDMPYPGNGDTLVTVNEQARAWTPETLYRKHRTQGFISLLSSGKFIIRLCFMKIWLTPFTPCINHMLCLHTFQDYPFGALNAKHRLDDKPSGLNTLAKSHIVTLQVTTAAISGLAASSWSEVNMTEISKSWIWSHQNHVKFTQTSKGNVWQEIPITPFFWGIDCSMHFRVFDCSSSFQVLKAKLQGMQRHLSASAPSHFSSQKFRKLVLWTLRSSCTPWL